MAQLMMMREKLSIKNSPRRSSIFSTTKSVHLASQETENENLKPNNKGKAKLKESISNPNFNNINKAKNSS
jgi:hypothetical protein